jgi:hypothetical protein
VVLVPETAVDIGEPLISLKIVLHSTGKIVTIVTLCCAIGLQWVALQSVAWTTMLFEYAKHAPLRQAIAQTFDGSRPCALCHAVNTGKKSEKKSEFQAATAKIDLICSARTICLLPPFTLFAYPASSFAYFDIGNSPPVPPPRSS